MADSCLISDDLFTLTKEKVLSFVLVVYCGFPLPQNMSLIPSAPNLREMRRIRATAEQEARLHSQFSRHLL